MFIDASDCYHTCSQYEEAVELLRRGDCFDELVAYASRYLHIICHLSSRPY
jgi:hypothetical protein